MDEVRLQQARSVVGGLRKKNVNVRVYSATRVVRWKSPSPHPQAPFGEIGWFNTAGDPNTRGR